MLREAQAVAKLNHPNVVSIHDVGSYDFRSAGKDDKKRIDPRLGSVASSHGVFVVMEFVRGRTLTEHVELEPSLEELVEIFMAAGRGLAAAHRAGLVHRDFKPGNVMIGNDGRVRVLDFGLARLEGERTPVEDVGLVSDATTLLGQTRTVAGTPAYMAPEQHRGEPLDGRADQFSFCVALYEAVSGRRPFPGKDMAKLGEAKAAGRFDPPGDRGSARLRAAIVRGLSPDPDDRFPSMDVLLEEIRPRAGRNRLALGLGAVLVAAAGAWFAGQAASGPDATALEACAPATLASQLDGVWDEDVQARLAAAFAATGKAYIEELWPRARPVFDRWATQWLKLRSRTCHARLEPASAELADRRDGCLSRRLAAFASAIDVLEEGEEAALARAARLAAGLGPLDRCMDDGALASAMPEDPEIRQQVDVLAETSARAEALLAATKFEEARKVLSAAVETARTVGHGPMTAQLTYQLSRAELHLGEFETSRALAADSWSIAEAAGDERGALLAAVGAAEVTGYNLARHQEGLVLLDVASGKLAHLGHLPRRAGELAYVRGLIAQTRSKWREAAEAFAESRRLFVEVHGEHSLRVGDADNSLGVAHLMLGELSEAETYFASGLEIAEALVGPNHPQTVVVVFNMGNLAYDRGDYKTALDRYTRARDVRIQAFGADSYLVGITIGNIANTLAVMGKYEEAEKQLREAVRIHAAAVGTEHPAYAMQLSNLGGILDMLGRHDEALIEHERSMALREQLLDPGHVDLAYGSASHGTCLYNLGRTREAGAAFRRSVALFEKTSGPETAQLVTPLWGVGVTELASGRRESAIGFLRRALEINLKTSGDEVESARIRFALARALWPDDPGGARELAEKARPTYDRLYFARDNAKVVDAWLTTHEVTSN
jgi:tetratricopeptide (TPR) repeat protein